MTISRSALLLLPAALLCSSCKDSGEFSPGSSPALSRSAVAAGRLGSFAGEAYRDNGITPMSPGLYLAPAGEVDITTLFYTNYDSTDLGAENWYDNNLSFFENNKRLTQIAKDDPARAARILRAYEEKARNGDTTAMINAGGLCHRGIGTSEDNRKAMEYFRMAAHPDSPNRTTAVYNIRYLQIYSDDFGLNECLSEFEAGITDDKSELEFGEQLYLFGKNKAKSENDRSKVREVLARVTPKDSTGSCDYVSALYHRHGHMGVQQNSTEALRLYRKAAEAEGRNGGYPLAQLALADIYHFGLLGQPQDKQKSLELYREAAAERSDSGPREANYRARTALAVDHLLKGQRKQPIAIAAHGSNRKADNILPEEALREAAEHGDDVAAYNLGILRLKSSGGSMNPQLLTQIAQGADCGQANVEALVRLYCGLHLAEARGKVSAKDVELLQKEAAPEAKVLLANCYATGTGVARDMREAFRLYSELADKVPAARYNLALCHEKAAGTARDNTKAAQLKAQAIEELRQAARN